MSSNVAPINWRVRTSFELFFTIVNVPKQIEAGHHPRDYLAAALFAQDLNTEKSETIGITSIVENRFPEDTHIQSSILLPLRFEQRQQLTIRVYSNAKEHFTSNSSSIQDKLQSLTSNMIGEVVFMTNDLFRENGLQQTGPDTMGFVRSLKTSSGSGLVFGSRPMQISLHWRERHYNNRSSKILATCTVDPAFKPSGLDKIASKPTWRLEATRECIVDNRTPDAKIWSQVISSGKMATASDPSWFLDMVSVDALIPEDGDPLRIKLWRTDPLRDQRLFGESFIKRQAVLKWIDLIEQEDKADARKREDNDRSVADRLSIIGTAPKLLEAPMRALDDESIVTAKLSLEAAKITRIFSLFEYLGGGMRFGLTIAIDVHSSNGEPTEAKSLHYDDPRKIEPSPYLRCMSPIAQFLIPFSNKIYPIGFAGNITNQTNANDIGFFHVCRTRPTGFIDTIEEFTAAYWDALPALQMGKTRHLAPVLSRAVDDASQAAKPNGSQSYSVVVVFTNGSPDDFAQVLKTVHDSAHVPISFIFVGIEPGRSSSRLQKTFERLRERPVRFVAGRLQERCNFQFVSTAGCNAEQASQLVRSMMTELEEQILSYMKEHRIQPAVVKPLAPPVIATAPESSRQPISRQLSEFVPAVSGVHSVARMLSRKPSLGRKKTYEEQAVDSDSSDKSNDSGAVSGLKSVALSREPSHSGTQEPSRLLSPGMSRAASRSRDVGAEANSSSRLEHVSAVPKEQTELDIQKDKENAANAIRDKYRLSPQKDMLEYRARTNLRDSIQLKLAVDAFEWKKQMSMVSDTLEEAIAAASFRSPHQKPRFKVHSKPANGMPRTIFNKGADEPSSRSRSSRK